MRAVKYISLAAALLLLCLVFWSHQRTQHSEEQAFSATFHRFANEHPAMAKKIMETAFWINQLDLVASGFAEGAGGQGVIDGLPGMPVEPGAARTGSGIPYTNCEALLEYTENNCRNPLASGKCCYLTAHSVYHWCRTMEVTVANDERYIGEITEGRTAMTTKYPDIAAAYFDAEKELKECMDLFFSADIPLGKKKKIIQRKIKSLKKENPIMGL